MKKVRVKSKKEVYIYISMVRNSKSQITTYI